MKTPQPHTQAAETRSVAPSIRQPRQARQASPDAAAIAHSPRMTAQRKAIRAAFGPAAAPAQLLRGDADQQLLDEMPSPATATQQHAAASMGAPDLTGMPNQLKSGLEAPSGMDMSEVRVMGVGALQQAALVGDRLESMDLQKKGTERPSEVVQGVFGEEYLLSLAAYFGVEGTVASVAAALGVSTGVLLAGLSFFALAGAVYSVSQIINYFSAKDPVEEAVLDEDKEGLKEDINSLMIKLRAEIRKKAAEKQAVANLLRASGRDWMIYAPWASWWSGMGDLLESWNTTWKVEETAGLLLDIGGVLRNLNGNIEDGKSIMNDYMNSSRTKAKKINKKSDWVKDLPKNTKVQAGVSATTGNLLLLIRNLNVGDNLSEVEALMNGAILYWKNSKLKQALGQFHTAAEVWAAYQYHIEEYANVANDDNHEKVD